MEDRLDLLLSRLEWRVAHLMAKREDVVPFSEWRVQWDALPPDEDEVETDEPSAAQLRAQAEDLRAAFGLSGPRRVRPLMPGGGAAVSDEVLKLFGGDPA